MYVACLFRTFLRTCLLASLVPSSDAAVDAKPVSRSSSMSHWPCTYVETEMTPACAASMTGRWKSWPVTGEPASSTYSLDTFSENPGMSAGAQGANEAGRTKQV